MGIIEKYDSFISINPVMIEGNYDTKQVWINSNQLYLEKSKAIFDHLATYFNWGSTGPGAAQLSLAILFEITGNKRISMILHHVFKNEFLARMHQSDFKITVNFGEWFEKHLEKDNMFLK